MGLSVLFSTQQLLFWKLEDGTRFSLQPLVVAVAFP